MYGNVFHVPRKLTLFMCDCTQLLFSVLLPLFVHVSRDGAGSSVIQLRNAPDIKCNQKLPNLSLLHIQSTVHQCACNRCMQQLSEVPLFKFYRLIIISAWAARGKSTQSLYLSRNTGCVKKKVSVETQLPYSSKSNTSEMSSKYESNEYPSEGQS